MPAKVYRPYTPSRRFITTPDFSEITRSRPEKGLCFGIRKKAGRNNTGRLMVYQRGGGHKRKYRFIDFKRDKSGVPGKVYSVEYDPNRSARIALIHYADGAKRYILCPEGLKVGAVVMSGPGAEIEVGNALPLSSIPDGTFVHNIELVPGRGGQFVRSAGSQAQLRGKKGSYAEVRMPSGETRLFPVNAMATIGQVGNTEHDSITIGNAGRMRHMGRRPNVRGTAMNSCDHPLGGGRGKSKGGNHPQSAWGQPSKGFRTRPKKIWDWMILQDRRQSKLRVYEGGG